MDEVIQVKIPIGIYNEISVFLKNHGEYGYDSIEHFIRSSLRFLVLLKANHIDVADFLSHPLQVQLENDNHIDQPSYRLQR